MHLIASIVIGFFAGLLARFLMPGRDSMGFVWTTILGIVGSVVANFIGSSMGFYGPDEPAGFVASVLGAVILLGIYQVVRRNKGGGSLTQINDRRAA